MLALVRSLSILMVVGAMGTAALGYYTVKTFHKQDIVNCKRVNHNSEALIDLINASLPQIDNPTVKARFITNRTRLKPEVCD